MPQFDVFVCARLKVEARDEVKAGRLVERLLDEHLRPLAAYPEVIEIADPQVLAEPAEDPVGMLVLGGRR